MMIDGSTRMSWSVTLTLYRRPKLIAQLAAAGACDTVFQCVVIGHSIVHHSDSVVCALSTVSNRSLEGSDRRLRVHG